MNIETKIVTRKGRILDGVDYKTVNKAKKASRELQKTGVKVRKVK